jgi:hypothetical protein
MRLFAASANWWSVEVCSVWNQHLAVNIHRDTHRSEMPCWITLRTASSGDQDACT